MNRTEILDRKGHEIKTFESISDRMKSKKTAPTRCISTVSRGLAELYWSPTMENFSTPKRIASFWAKVKVAESGCWEWSASRDRTGYGQFKYDGSMRGAHRFAYEVAIGPIPEGLHLDHLCRNPPCVNPDHLEPVTQAENTRRGFRALVSDTCKHGHEWTAENTYVNKGGYRVCRKCTSIAQIAYQARVKARVEMSA